MICLQVCLVLIQVYSPFFTAYPGMRLNLTDGTFYPANSSEIFYGVDANKINQSIGTDLVATESTNLGVFAIWRQAEQLGRFIGIIAMVFPIATLMTKFWVPPLLAWFVQGLADFVIFYGLLQLYLGRAGKSVE